MFLASHYLKLYPHPDMNTDTGMSTDIVMNTDTIMSKDMTMDTDTGMNTDMTMNTAA